MGGNALKKVITERKNKDDYETIKKYILEKISKYIKCETVIEIPGKQSFGDLDILYVYDSKINIRELITQLFSPIEIVINGDVMSFDYENFQIDFIKCSSDENLNSSQFYFAYADIGSIIGRILNHYGLKFGNNGLWLNLIDNTLNVDKAINLTKNAIGKIILSKEPREICEFLGLNYDKWKSGFLHKIEIFNWVIQSKYFKKEIFHNLNHEHRKRVSIRPLYKEFLDYINITISDIGITDSKNSEIKINLQKESIIYFNKNDELNKLIKDKELQENRKQKFNGKMLMEFGIVDKDIGIYINNFKDFIKNKFNENFEDWLDHNQKTHIEEEIKIFLFKLINTCNYSY